MDPELSVVVDGHGQVPVQVRLLVVTTHAVLNDMLHSDKIKIKLLPYENIFIQLIAVLYVGVYVGVYIVLYI